MKWADHVGRTFRAFGCRYRCSEYDPRKGLLMVLLSGTSTLFPDRKPGHETWVSERAIDRTFHEIYDFETSRRSS